MTNIPYIPDNAPFTPEQRSWLNGLLAGLFSDAPQAAGATAVALKVAVYFATQSGTAERLAKKVVKSLKAQGHAAELMSLDKVTVASLAAQENALVLASTYGEGDPPDGVAAFRDALFSDAAPMLAGLRYAVFALGDAHYEQFCKFGIDVDERLHGLGAMRLMARVESDVEVDAPFEGWMAEVVPCLAAKGDQPKAAVIHAAAGSADAVHVHTRDNPFYAELIERTALTTDISSKLTMHLAFDLHDSEVHYEAGDACGVIAENDPRLVDEILAALPFSESETVELPKVGRVSVRDALLHHLQPSRLTRKMVHAFAEKTACRTLSALLPAEQGAHLEGFMYDRGLIDLLHAHPGAVSSAEELAAMLPRLAPRLYSISSSPAAHGREVHCTIAVVRYRSHNRERGGIASTMLAERTDVGCRRPIYIQPNKRFRLPSVGETPMIMIGPGTGIAPFRSFLHERQALGQKGRNWLFFGERSAKTDFLYCEELKTMVESGHLTHLDTAFSRDQTHKIYVQDRMVEQGAEMWRWLKDGAQVFVCGDALRMAKDVDAALHAVVQTHGGMDVEAAQDYVSQLHEDRRYHRDVY